MEAIKGEQTLTELSQRFDVHAGQVTQWKNQFLERAAEIFERPLKPSDPPVDIKVLHAKIGELALENDFLEGALTKAGLLSARR